MRLEHVFVLSLAVFLAACGTDPHPQRVFTSQSQIDSTVTAPAAYAMATPAAGASSVPDLSKSANPCARGVDDAITQLEKLMAAKGAKPYVSAAAY